MAIATCKGMGIKMNGLDSQNFINNDPNNIMDCIY